MNGEPDRARARAGLRRRELGLLALAAACPVLARAADVLTTLLVPYPAGGPGDVAARQMLPLLRNGLGHVVIAENLAGAGGALAVQKMLSAPPDGRTLVLGTPNETILAPLALSAVKYAPEQLRLLGMVNVSPLVLVGAPQLPYATLADLLAAQRKPGAKQLNYGTSGIGSLFHLVSEDFCARAGLQMLHVPYKGTAPLLQDLVGGQIDLAFVPTGGSVPAFINEGRLRAYALTRAQRYERLPAVPTMAQAAGIDGFDYELWGGIFGSREVPEATQRTINAAINQALQDPGLQEQMRASGGSAGRPLSLEQAQEFFQRETLKYQQIARSIRLERQ